MRRWVLLFAGAAVLPLVAEVRAADIAVPKATTAVQTTQAAPLWAGIYLGVNLGFGWTDADWRNLTSAPAASFFDHVPGDRFNHSADGIIGGGQIGFNHQVGGWVFGVEALFDASDISGSRISSSRFGAADDEFTARIDMLLLATGRVGYAWGQALGYVKGGYAGAKVGGSVNDAVGPFTGSGSDSRWASGWTVGGGFEYAVTPNLSLGAEYNYVELGSERYQLGGRVGDYAWNLRAQSLHLVLAKLNYRFNWFQ
jgi:outer membrane immunogenic protein